MLVRRARIEDLDALADLCGQLGYPTSPARLGERFARLVSGDHVLFVTVDADDRPRGWLHAQRQVSLTDDPTALVSGLVVDEGQRGRGLGRLLMRAAEDWARTQGLAILRLRSRSTRSGAHAFYRALGYEELKVQAVFHKRLDSGAIP